MGMTLQQLDDVLKVWKTRLSAIAENLLELQSDTTYQSLTGTGGLQEIAVTGATAARVQPALRAMNLLFEQFGLLQSTVDQAEKMRESLPTFFSADAKLREIEILLFARSIEIPTANVPLTERALLAGPQQSQKLAPEELLDLMTRTFASLRDAVAEVGHAWTQLAEAMDRVEKEIVRLRSQCALPTAVLSAALDGVETRLAELKTQTRADPLGALAAVRTVVEPALASASQRVVAAEQLSAELRLARSQWDKLQRDHAVAAGSATQAQEKVCNGQALPEPTPESKLQGLGEWLVRLEHKRAEGTIEAVAIGLRNWMAAADACATQDRRALAASEGRLASRGELRGRFDALKAKARAYGVAESGEAADLATSAEQLLYTRPMDLDRAAAAVARYEQSLRAVQRDGERIVGQR